MHTKYMRLIYKKIQSPLFNHILIAFLSMFQLKKLKKYIVFFNYVFMFFYWNEHVFLTKSHLYKNSFRQQKINNLQIYNLSILWAEFRMPDNYWFLL